MFGKKTLSIYAVAAAEDPDTYIGYAATFADAKKYFEEWLHVKWAENFLIWCKWCPEENPESEESWNKYLAQEYVAEQNLDYYIYKLKFNADGVSALLRMHDMCIPFNLPFIKDVEKAYFLQATENIDNITLNKVKKQLSGVLNAGDVTLVGDTNGAE